MASSGKRGLGCLVLVVLFLVTWALFWKWSARNYEEFKQRDEEAAVKIGPAADMPIIAVVEEKLVERAKSKSVPAPRPKWTAYLIEHGDMGEFLRQFPAASLKVPLEKAGELNAGLMHWPPDKDGWKMTGSFSVVADGDKQLVTVKSENKPPPNADPEIGTSYREVTYRTDGKSIELKKVRNRNSEGPMRAGVLALTFNIGFWICIGVACALFRVIYWFVKRFRMAN